MSIKVLIVDDERLARKRVDDVLQNIQSKIETISVGECDNAEDAWSLIIEDSPDVILLDIHMPNVSGIDLAKRLKTLDNPPQIIFLTAFSDYALTAFDVNAIDYILKPIQEDRLLEALFKVKHKLSNTFQKCISAYYIENKQKILIGVNDILVITADWRATQLWTSDTFYYGSDVSLQKLEDDYSDIFIRIHRGTLINSYFLDKIQQDQTEDNKWCAYIKGMSKSFSISRRLLSSVKQQLVS